MLKFLSPILFVAILQMSFSVFAQKPIAVEPTDAIAQVVTANWMSNFPDGKFYPERTISRAELATIMVKAFKLDKRIALSKENVSVADVPALHWAYRDIQTVLKTDIMRGYRGNLFS